MYKDMHERVLVPLETSTTPSRALLCIEGVSQSSRARPILLGPSVPEKYLDRPLREYLEDKAKEMKHIGITASPVFAQGGMSDSLLALADKGDVAMFIISIHGPYQIKRQTRPLSFEKQPELTFGSYRYSESH